jgi:pyridoxine 5-phosphate synthase
LDAAGQKKALEKTCMRLATAGIVVSLFIEPDEKQLSAAAEIGAPYVELHTGTFCNAGGAAAKKELKRLIAGARYAHDMGLQVNAGHGINLENIRSILKIPFLDTLNIGHSIVARAVFVGIKNAVREMLAEMERYRI